MDSNEILVSVIVLTYNHQEYIRQALDSILMQNVDFRYEILVGEDCSPDNTRKILTEYNNEYPDKFKIIYRNENIGAKKNLKDLYSRASGKYLALLEGDDFWTDPNKLRKQVSFLEDNPEVIATAHQVLIVDKFGNVIKDKGYPSCKDDWYTLKHFKNGILPGQSASIVKRNIYKNRMYDMSIMDKISPQMPGDRVSYFLLVSHGSFFCFQDVMSAYRYVTDSGTSFSAIQQKKRLVNPLSLIEYYSQITNHAQKHINNQEAIVTIECIYLWQCVSGFFKFYQGISINTIKTAICRIQNKNTAILYVLTNLVKVPIKYFKSKISRWLNG